MLVFPLKILVYALAYFHCLQLAGIVQDFAMQIIDRSGSKVSDRWRAAKEVVELKVRHQLNEAKRKCRSYFFSTNKFSSANDI